MGISGLGYIGLGVSDIDRWRAFATTGVLGLQESEEGLDGTVYLRMDEHHHRFAITPTGEDDVVFVGWEVPTAEALDEMAEHLTKRGISFEEGTPEELEHRKVVRMIKLREAGGAPIEIFHGPLVLWERPFLPTTPISGFNTGSLGLGHMILFQKDLKEATEFYRDVLGFKVSDYIAVPVLGDAVFFHCNPRHHSIAIVEVDAPKHLQHIMLEVKSLDDVGLAYYRCKEFGTPLSLDIGRHTNDHMFSFYMSSPSGFDIEYGWGGRLIDDATWVVQRHVSPAIWGHQPVRREVEAG
jgi:2,3-dihydroxybiphenyl 1,2-dioxygenase